ncbi:MAG: 2-oxo acid dehydrogenase subunit E2, partial [Mycetocola sp.]
MSSQLTGVGTDDGSSGEFGANEWLVDELYEQYSADKNSVDESWWPILESYQPVKGDKATGEIPAHPITAPIPVIGSQPVAKTTSVQPKAAPIPADAPRKTPAKPTPAEDSVEAEEPVDTVAPLRGMAKSLATNMDASLTVPTATSVRTIPAKLMIDNRIVINNHLKRARGGKVSFTHLIGWALIQALIVFPSQNVYYTEVDGKPSVVKPAHVGLGIAIDIPKPDGSRALLVPAIKRADTMTFSEYLAAYEDLVKRARGNKLTADDFNGASISLTNPGGIGTVHSVPRLMKGAGCIIGAGALEYPAEFQGSSEKTLAN